MGILFENVSSYLLEHNIKPSYPRIRIMEYLAEKKSHPTVDEIYNALAREIPTLSKTTVYNTLNLFTGAKIARVVTIEDNETRYDADTADHGHFKCEKCEAVYDFRINTEGLEAEDMSAYRIHEKNVYYKGICPKCLENKNMNSGGINE